MRVRQKIKWLGGNKRKREASSGQGCSTTKAENYETAIRIWGNYK